MISVMKAPNGNTLQYSCLENPMDRGVWWATVHGVTEESDMTQQLKSNNNYTSERALNSADITRVTASKLPRHPEGLWLLQILLSPFGWLF